MVAARLERGGCGLKERVMIDKYKEGIDDFIENHLDRDDFAFLVLPIDERLRKQAMEDIKSKFWDFWYWYDSEEEGRDDN